jgi:DNA-3-methyladenine glycosylase
MGIDLAHNGTDLTQPPLYLATSGDGGEDLRGSPIGCRRRWGIVAGPRIGIRAATDRPWRFGLRGHPSLSRPFGRAL